jgi:hypothetical protein
MAPAKILGNVGCTTTRARAGRRDRAARRHVGHGRDADELPGSRMTGTRRFGRRRELNSHQTVVPPFNAALRRTRWISRSTATATKSRSVRFVAWHKSRTAWAVSRRIWTVVVMIASSFLGNLDIFEYTSLTGGDYVSRGMTFIRNKRVFSSRGSKLSTGAAFYT